MAKYNAMYPNDPDSDDPEEEIEDDGFIEPDEPWYDPVRAAEIAENDYERMLESRGS